MKNHAANDATWSLNKDVHEPPRSQFWYACFRDERGRRTRRSTKTTDKTLAAEIAMKWAQLAQAGRAGRLTESQCRNVIQQMYERAVGQPLHFDTARTFLLEWLQGTTADTEPSTYKRYKQVIDSFLAHLGIKADRLLREVTSKDVRSWRDALKAGGRAAPTVNQAVKTLRIPFRVAADNGIIDINPNTKSSLPLLRDEAENVTKDVFTPEQIAALIKAAPSEDWKGAILCGYTTGLRLKDTTDLPWGSVDLDEHVITIKTKKTRRTVVLPIHPSFAAWLKKQMRGIGKAALFPTLAGKSGHGRSGLSEQFRGIMARANIKGRPLRESTGKGRSQSSLSFHSLRYSFVSALAAAGIGVETRQSLTGHASVEMNRHYAHADLETKRAAVLKLPAIPKAKARAR